MDEYLNEPLGIHVATVLESHYAILYFGKKLEISKVQHFSMILLAKNTIRSYFLIFERFLQ